MTSLCPRLRLRFSICSFNACFVVEDTSSEIISSICESSGGWKENPVTVDRRFTLAKREGNSLRRRGRSAARPQARRATPGSTVDPILISKISTLLFSREGGYK